MNKQKETKIASDIEIPPDVERKMQAGIKEARDAETINWIPDTAEERRRLARVGKANQIFLSIQGTSAGLIFLTSFALRLTFPDTPARGIGHFELGAVIIYALASFVYPRAIQVIMNYRWK